MFILVDFIQKVKMSIYMELEMYFYYALIKFISVSTMASS